MTATDLAYLTRGVIGEPVRCLEGQTVGNIEEVVVSLATGTIRYAILHCGDSVTREDREDRETYMAVPWRALSRPFRQPEAPRFVLPLPIETCRRAPSFTRDACPDFGDSREMADVHSFYGEPPAW